MTTISAGAAAGLLVALMVISTSDGFGAEPLPASEGKDVVQPVAARGNFDAASRFRPDPADGRGRGANR